MDELLLYAVNKHFNTLSAMGNIKNQEKYNLFTILTVYDIYNTYREFITKEDAEYFNKYIECHAQSLCLFDILETSPNLCIINH